MILAFTGAGISRASGIPTFQDRDGLRDRLTRDFARGYPAVFRQTIAEMTALCECAEPNDAHVALAEYSIPVITMNVDGLHRRAGTERFLAIHGDLPNIVLYGDPAPRYEDAHNWVFQLREGDVFLAVGSSFYTNVSVQLRAEAAARGATVIEINENAEQRVRECLEAHENAMGSFQEFLGREVEA